MDGPVDKTTLLWLQEVQTLHICQCGDCFGKPVWHCPGCHSHWYMDHEPTSICGTCQKTKRPAKADSLPLG